MPGWAIRRQRAFHLTRRHLDEGDTLPTEPASSPVRARTSDAGSVPNARAGASSPPAGSGCWGRTLGVEPADTAAEQPKPRTTHADKWSLDLAAATRYYERDGHLQVPREHIETVGVPPAGGEGPEQRGVRLGTWISNQRSRAAALAVERVEQLTALGMRCS
ncbi:helicase associated domain-containing protein [Streptomyces sp. NPDC087659]|uniref:helicase associated domain-containing protein n=1 Tax=unclassified Streptomyces TaxID=2593676 RepID=UPI00369FBF43